MPSLPSTSSSVPIGTWAMVVLFIAGIGLWATAGLAYVGEELAWMAAVGVFAVTLFAGIRMPPTATTLERLRRPNARQRRMTTSIVFACSIAYLAFVAWWQKRSLLPAVSDEYGYLLSAQLLARGRLWFAAHPLGDFFESFQILVRGVYASSYFPGTGLFLAPAIWIGAPFWIVMLAIAGAIAALLYLVFTELFDDGLIGLLAVVVALSQGMFRTLAFSAMAQLPTLLLGLLLIWFWLRWRRQPRWWYALAIGVFAGWAAITRPVDAICYVVPVTLVLLWELRRLDRRTVTMTLVWGLVGAAPFAAMQLIFNKGVSGSWTTTPFAVNAERDFPGTAFGFHAYDPSVRPTSQLPQKQEQYDAWVAPKVASHVPEQLFAEWAGYRLPVTLLYTLPNPLLVALLPVGLLAITTRPRLIVLSVLVLFVALYACYTFFLFHYPITVLPAVLVLLGSAIVAVERHAPPRYGGPVAAAMGAAIAALAIVSAPPISTAVTSDRMFDTPVLDAFEQRLTEVKAPAVVLVRYGPGSGSPHEEPVYNVTTAWPDDASVIRAQDLGPARDAELFAYYGQRQPQRNVYRFDRSNGSLTFLGTAGDLATSPPRP